MGGYGKWVCGLGERAGEAIKLVLHGMARGIRDILLSLSQGIMGFTDGLGVYEEILKFQQQAERL